MPPRVIAVSFFTMDILEIFGTAVGLLYLYLEYRASVWLWLASVVMPAIYIFVYYDAGLYADVAISVYYLAASVYGLVCWLHPGGKAVTDGGGGDDRITHTPRRYVAGLVAVGVGLFLAIGFALKNLTDSTVPWADGFTTALSIVAMWMLAKKYVEQWLIWLVADFACSVLYIYKDLYFTGVLYGIYAVIAWFGYRRWLRMMAEV